VAEVQITLGELKDRGSGHPAPDSVVRLYHQAFDQFGTRALWNWRHLEQPTVTQALAIADSLRAEGNLAARRLAESIEQACRAAV
jgi:hypothetical protein